MRFLIRSYGDTDFITGLRCIAALMVIAIHTGAFRDFGVLGNTITDNGKYGVHIFFVISGYTIARTYAAADNYTQYFGRRFLRIAPLYYALTGLAFVLIALGTLPRPYWMEFYGSAPDAYNAVMHLTFLSAWDARVTASLLGVEWTIPIEMFWYAVLPLLLPVAATTRKRLYIFGALIGLAALAKIMEYLFLPKHAAHFMPISYGGFFYLGVVAEALRRHITKTPIRNQIRWYWGAVALFGLGLVVDSGLNTLLLGVGTAAIIVLRRGASRSRGLLCARPMLLLGSISYSLYLIHYLAIYMVAALPALQSGIGLVHFAVVLALTTALSVATYLMIEYPSNQLGKRIFAKSTSAPRTPRRENAK